MEWTCLSVSIHISRFLTWGHFCLTTYVQSEYIFIYMLCLFIFLRTYLDFLLAQFFITGFFLHVCLFISTLDF